MIEDWRQEIGYADFLLKEHALAQQFHTHCKNDINPTAGMTHQCHSTVTLAGA